MLQSPADNILVEITKRYEDELQFASGVKLYVDPRFNPNFHATSEGIVHSVPATLTYSNKDIKQIIRPGDEVLFSYKTVGDITYTGGTDMFRMTTKKEGFHTEWMNQDRQTIILDKGPRMWAAVYADKRGGLIAGKTGSQGECENWIAQNFKFATAEGFTYDNRLQWKDKELWKVDYSYVFAIRREGHMKMVGDYVLVEPICEKKTELISPSLYRPEGDRMLIREDKGWCRCGGKGGFRNGDVIIFDPTMKEKYNIQNSPMYIVKRDFILGRELKISSIEAISNN